MSLLYVARIGNRRGDKEREEAPQRKSLIERSCCCNHDRADGCKERESREMGRDSVHTEGHGLRPRHITLARNGFHDCPSSRAKGSKRVCAFSTTSERASGWIWLANIHRAWSWSWFFSDVRTCVQYGERMAEGWTDGEATDGHTPDSLVQCSTLYRGKKVSVEISRSIGARHRTSQPCRKASIPGVDR
jgi:hypothetical protein